MFPLSYDLEGNSCQWVVTVKQDYNKTLQEEMKPKMQIQVFSHKEEPPKDSIPLNLDWV